MRSLLAANLEDFDTVPKYGTLIVPESGTVVQVHEALFSRARCEILALYFLNPGRRFYLREVARRLGLGHSSIQEAIEQFYEAELLTRQREGRRIYYQANPQSFVFDELKALIEKTIGPVGKIRVALHSLRTKIDVAFVYGSIADETASDESDVDLMVVGSVTFEEIVRCLMPVQDEVGREINPSVYPREEFREKLEAKNAFLETVMENPKKLVIGDLRELEHVA